MQKIISKELLGCVLCKNVLSFNIKGNEILIQFDNYDDILNIYELAHKCKEWAVEKGYHIFTVITESGIYSAEVNIFRHALGYIMEHKCVSKINEVEAVIESCKWVYEEIQK